MLSWVGIAMGLVALRNVPIAAVFAFPTLGLGLQDRLAERARAPRRALAPSKALGRRLMEMATAAAIVIGATVVLVPGGVGDGVTANIEKRFPVPSVELLKEVAPDARVLGDYGWGGYLIHELYGTGGRVFVDGRNDMYDQAILEDYDAIREADPNWQDLVAEYGVNAILLKPDAALTRGPAEQAGWCEAYRNETQVLYLPVCPG
jgi:hypothetical protein